MQILNTTHNSLYIVRFGLGMGGLFQHECCCTFQLNIPQNRAKSLAHYPVPLTVDCIRITMHIVTWAPL